MQNGTWELQDLPAGRTAITNRWIFKRRLNPDGSTARYKARLVVRGFSQKEGIHYNETFSLVVKSSSVKCLFAIAAQEGDEVHQMDVQTAFLNDILEEEVYMVQHEEFVSPKHPNKVCRLRKTQYGLK